MTAEPQRRAGAQRRAQALFDAAEVVPSLPVCDHYAGVEARMRKSLALQAELGAVFDVTLDNEDGAPVGAELDQAQCIASLLADPLNRHGRVGVRLLPLAHPRFHDVAATILGAARRPAYLMLPKPGSAACIDRAAGHRTRSAAPTSAACARRDPWRGAMVRHCGAPAHRSLSSG